jgi:prepilin-type processing-associated H-X9-DG protein
MPSPRSIRLTLLISCLVALFVLTVVTLELVHHIRSEIALNRAVANLVTPPPPPVAPGSDGNALVPVPITQQQMNDPAHPHSDFNYYVGGQTLSQVSSTQPIASQTFDYARHHGGMNILFGDGHVEWYTFGWARSILPPPPTTAPAH